MENGKSNRRNELLASFGADRRRWPDAERDAFSAQPDAAEGDAREIDRLLSLASEPPGAGEAMARLLDRMEQESPAQVIPFRPRPKPRVQSFLRFAALPLAASLALGIYLGAQGDLDFAFPNALTGAVAQADDTPDDLGGVGEADAYAEGNLT